MFHSLLTFLFVLIVAVANVGVGYMAAALMGRGPCRWRKERRLAWRGWVSASSEVAAKEDDVEDIGPTALIEDEGKTADTSAGPSEDGIDSLKPETLSTAPTESAKTNIEAVLRFHVVLDDHHDDLSSFKIDLEQHSEDEEIEELHECAERLKEIIQKYISGRDRFVAELSGCSIDDDVIDNLRNEMILASDIRTAEVCSTLASLDKSELNGKNTEELYAQLRDDTKEMKETVLNLQEIIEQAESMLVIPSKGEAKLV